MDYTLVIKTENEENESVTKIGNNVNIFRSSIKDNTPFIFEYKGSCRESLTKRYAEASSSIRNLDITINSDEPVNNIKTKNRIINKLLLNNNHIFDIDFSYIHLTERKLVPEVISLIWYIYQNDTWVIKNTATVLDVCKHLVDDSDNPFDLEFFSRVKMATFYWGIANKKIDGFKPDLYKKYNGPVNFIDGNCQSLVNDFHTDTGITVSSEY
jgi:hypothetical protein